MTDYATRRRIMVDSQVRPSDVTRYPIIEAMLAVPRERFVPDDAREIAYADDNIPLGEGRCVLAPRTMAKMLESLAIEPDELVLHVGAGLGYGPAVIARLAEAVIALEPDADMAAEAQAQLAEVDADNVAVVDGALAAGAPQHGPYDAILVEGAVEVLPRALEDQLKEGGRICCVFAQGRFGQARIGIRSGGVLSWRWAFDAGAPVLPGFERKREFAL